MSKSKASQPTLRDRASAWPYLSGVVIWWSTRTVAALFKENDLRSANHRVNFGNLLIS
jgi:hypothetical protein